MLNEMAVGEPRQCARNELCSRAEMLLFSSILIFFKEDIVQLKESDTFHTENITVDCRILGTL